MKDKFFLKSLRLIPGNWKKWLAAITFGIILTSIIETGAMGFIAVFVSAINDPEIISHSNKLRMVTGFIPRSLLKTPFDTLFVLGTIACSLLILKNVCSAAITYAYSRFSANMDALFGEMLMKNYLCHEYEWHVGRHSADLVTAGTWRKYILPAWYMAILALNDIVLVTMLGVTLLYAVPIISVVTIAVFGLMAVGTYSLLRPKIDREAKAIARFEQRINKSTTDITQGIKEILIASKQHYFFNNYQKDVLASANAQARNLVLARTPSWAFESVGFLLLCGTVIASLALNEHIPPSVLSGKLALLGVIAWRILPAFNRIVNNLSSLRDHLPKADGVINAIFNMPDRHYPNEAATPLPLEREIRIENLNFQYNEAPQRALADITMTIPSGSTVGLVGRSGSGKSTLADIIIGLLSQTSGTITIDGQNLSPENKENWIASIGYVGQSPFFTDGSILENVAFGLDESMVDREKLLNCCHMAALDTLIDQLPGGIDRPLGERAEKLSGGQRQRVAIARALYRSPQLLILDEATSALDQQSENTIKTTVKRLAGSLTMLIIAHRLSTVEHCDKIIWLEHGKIVMEGSPEDVLPHYRASLNEKTNNVCEAF